MRSLDDALLLFEQLFQKESVLELERKDLLHSPLPPAWRDEQESQIKNRLDRLNSYKKDLLSDVITFPPQHRRHSQALDDFHKISPFKESVFIMTKYPDGNTRIDQELRFVIESVKTAVKECGYVPHLASDKRFHALLWDNGELYLLACGKGIAIVESRYKEELNPNVAMEWGWMRAMGRDVLYLAEETFDLTRADWGGLIQDKFPWTDPNLAVQEAVHRWLNHPNKPTL